MKLRPPLSEPVRVPILAAVECGPIGMLFNPPDRLADAVPVIDCRPVNCIGLRCEARTMLSSMACCVACSASRLKLTALPEYWSTTAQPDSGATASKSNERRKRLHAYSIAHAPTPPRR